MALTHEAVLEGRDKILEALAESKQSFRSEQRDLKAKLVKIDAWLWDNTAHSADSVVEEYVALRDSRSELKKEYDEDDASIKEHMHKLEVWLKLMLEQVGAKSFRTDHGTAYMGVSTRANCSDWPSLWAYIRENDRFDMLEKRVSQKPITDMLDEDGQVQADKTLPPGINLYQETTVTIRRS